MPSIQEVEDRLRSLIPYIKIRVRGTQDEEYPVIAVDVDGDQLIVTLEETVHADEDSED